MKNTPMHLMFDFILIAGLLIVFTVTPPGRDWFFFIPCTFVFLIYALFAILEPAQITQGIKTHVNARLLFMVFSYVLYFHPYFLDGLGLNSLDSMGRFGVKYVEQSNFAIVISTAAIISFSAGYKARVIFRAPDKMRQEVYNCSPILPVVLICVFLFSFIIFFSMGGAVLIRGAYFERHSLSSAVNYASYVATLASMVMVASFVFRFRYGTVTALETVSISLAITWAFVLLFVGDRNSLLLFVITAGAGFFSHCARGSLFRLAILLIVGFSLYTPISVARQMENKTASELVSVVFDPTYRTGIAESNLSNTTAVTRAVLFAVPEKVNYSFGKITGDAVLGVIPFSRRWFVDRSAVYKNSTDIASYFLLPPTARQQTGTNIVADSYADFGIIYVLVVFFAIGLMGGYFYARAQFMVHNHNAQVLFMISVAVIAEVPRYGMAFPIRYIVWAAVLLWASDILARIVRNSRAAHS